MSLIIPKNNADRETLGYTLQVYYDANGWVENSQLINRLSDILLKEGIETEKKEPQSYTKKTQVLSYFGFIEWQDKNNSQSSRKITKLGIEFYEALITNNQQEIDQILLNCLSNKTFGRNVLGCDSDSDVEAPNIYIKASILLDGISNIEFAYIVYYMDSFNLEFDTLIAEVKSARKLRVELVLPKDAEKFKDPKPITALKNWGILEKNEDGKIGVRSSLFSQKWKDLCKLKITNNQVQILQRNEETQGILTYEGYGLFLSALKTKPFLLLAGISGTGKSRKVQELAYMTCPRDGRLDQDEAKPGNYMLIEVKPNWHDSTELLGYYSNISGKYMLTDFIRFIHKAWLNPQVPFFVCLDEMNLAPVEQYFAEYLSVLETRKDVKGTIISAELLTKESFKDIKTDRRRPITSDEDDGVRDVTESLYSPEDALTIDFIKKNGLRLPENLFVVGTVNMDDTTHQFSRKVIDRAFTIEMNGGNLADMFDKNDTLQYQEQPLPWEVIKPDFVRAQDVLDTFEEDRESIKNKAPELLNGINQEDIFGNTPFRVSYRVMNEMTLYFATLRTRNKEASADELLNTAFMTILLQKVLPRVEGDEKALHCDDGGHSVILAKLKSFLSANFMSENSPSSTSDIYDELIKKIDEMERRLEDTYFTSFFS